MIEGNPLLDEAVLGALAGRGAKRIAIALDTDRAEWEVARKVPRVVMAGLPADVPRPDLDP